MCGDCGLHHSILDDGENHPLKIVDDVCKVGAAIDRHLRVNAEKDREFEKKQPDVSEQPLKKRIEAAKKPHPADGRHTRLRWMSPDELAQAQHPNDEPEEG